MNFVPGGARCSVSASARGDGAPRSSRPGEDLDKRLRDRVGHQLAAAAQDEVIAFRI